MTIKQTNIEKEPLFILKLLLSLIVIPMFYWFVFLFAKSFVASSTQIVLKKISLIAIKNVVTYYFLPGISILSGMTNTIFLKKWYYLLFQIFINGISLLILFKSYQEYICLPLTWYIIINLLLIILAAIVTNLFFKYRKKNRN